MLGALALGLGAGLAVWALALGCVVAAGRSRALDDPARIPYLCVAAVAYGVVAVVLVACLLRIFGSPAGIGLRRPTVRDVLAILAGTAVVAGLRVATFGYLALIGRSDHVQAGLSSFHVASVLGAVLTVGVGATIAPFAEELVYRGTIYRLLAAIMPAGRAAFLSALVFAAARWDLALFPFFAAYGVVLALLYRRTGNLVVPMAVRSLFDGASYALLVWLDVAT